MSDAATLPSPADLAARVTVSQPNESAAYRAARLDLLADEIALRRQIEAVAAKRRALPPGGAATGDYRFNGADGPTDLAGLFGDRDTLVVYSWMFGPERKESCPMCANLLNALAGNAADIRQNVALAIVARSPVERMRGFADMKGWRDMPLYQDVNDAYSRDYHGLIPEGEIPALNVFTRRDGTIRHFWAGESTGETADPGQDPRGAPEIAPLWNILDLTPDGRAPDWYPKLRY